MHLDLRSIADAVQASLAAQFDALVVDSVVIDSRLVQPGALFVCIPGERVDGHDFAAVAVENGAVALLASRPLPESTVPVLLVPDTVKALGLLAKAWRARFRGKVVGITGTAGKTTVKELLADLLAQCGTVAKTEKNHNNQIGMPLAILAASGNEAFWVMEAGISHKGDMEELADILRPDFAVVLNAGTGHTEGLGKEGVAWHKTRMLCYLAEGGVGIASADYPGLAEHAKEADPNTLFFSAKGKSPACCTAREIETNGERTRYEISVSAPLAEDSFEVDTVFRGDAGCENCAAISLIALLLGATKEQIQKGIASVSLPAHRFRHITYARYCIIDDTYNANPLSMTRMVDAASREARLTEKTLCLVLGEMRELGTEAYLAHRELGRQVGQIHPYIVVWKGDMADAFLEGLRERGVENFYTAPTVEDFIELAKRELLPLAEQGALVLFKGSRSNKLEEYEVAFEELVKGEKE